MLISVLTASDLEIEQMLCLIRGLTFYGYNNKTQKSLVGFSNDSDGPIIPKVVSLADDCDWLLKEAKKHSLVVNRICSFGDEKFFVSVPVNDCVGFSASRNWKLPVEFETETCNKAYVLGAIVANLGTEVSLKPLQWGLFHEMLHGTSV